MADRFPQAHERVYEMENCYSPIPLAHFNGADSQQGQYLKDTNREIGKVLDRQSKTTLAGFWKQRVSHLCGERRILKSDSSLFFFVLTHSSSLLPGTFFLCHSRREMRDNGISLYQSLVLLCTACCPQQLHKPRNIMAKVWKEYLQCKHLSSLAAV